MCDPDARDGLLEWIDSSRPRLVVMSNCCPRAPPVEFIQRVFDLQLARGDHAMAELPFGEVWGVETMAANMIRHPRVRCVLGPKSVHEQEVRDAWAVSSEHIADEIEKRGDSRQLEASVGQSGKDWKSRMLAKAVCGGYVQQLKSNDPGRIRRMLRNVAARIRRRKRLGEDDVSDLRWSERTIAKALKRWNVVFVQGDEGHVNSDSDEEMIPDMDVEQPAASTQPVKSRLSSEGISFEVPDGRRVSDAVKSGLIKAHCNLGHPSVADLQRFLKLGGAKKEVIEAAGWMKCMTCAHSRRPATNRVSSIPPCQITFGDEVQLDCFCIHDADKKSHWFLSIIDRATSFHVIELMRDHSPYELHRAFDRSWMKWAGPPLRATTDLEGGFQGREFWEQVGEAGTCFDRHCRNRPLATG
eukprot:s656_g2.t1